MAFVDRTVKRFLLALLPFTGTAFALASRPDLGWWRLLILGSGFLFVWGVLKAEQLWQHSRHDPGSDGLEV